MATERTFVLGRAGRREDGTDPPPPDTRRNLQARGVKSGSGTYATDTTTQTRGDPVEGGLSKLSPVDPSGPSSVPALLGRLVMPPARRTGTQTRSGTKGSQKTYVVPYPGPFFISVIAVTTIVAVRVGEPSHKGTVLEKPRLGILDKPKKGVIIVYNFPAPQNQGVGQR